MRVPYLPLNKAVGIGGSAKAPKKSKAKGQEQMDRSNASGIPDFSKDDGPKSKDKNYKPAVTRGLPEPPGEGDVVEFHHPKHGMKTRGRVTAVGTDGYKARIADGSAIDVPHSHTVATLPVGDYGTETGVSPQDAKDAFLGPTKEGGLPATPLQIAVLDVLGQYGFPIDEQSIHTINYDQAKRVLTKYLMDDRSANEMPDSGQDDYKDAKEDQEEGGQGEDAGEDDSEGTPDDPDSEDSKGEDEGMADTSGGDTNGSEDDAPPEFPEVTGGQQQGSMTPGTQGQGSDGPGAAQEHVDGTDVSGATPTDDEGEVMSDPDVLDAVKQLIGALQTTSQAVGTPDEESTGHKDAKKHPNVKKKVAALVNASSKRIPPRKTQGA